MGLGSICVSGMSVGAADAVVAAIAWLINREAGRGQYGWRNFARQVRQMPAAWSMVAARTSLFDLGYRIYCAIGTVKLDGGRPRYEGKKLVRDVVECC